MHPFRKMLKGIYGLTFFGVLFGISLFPQEAAANIVGNPGFEVAIGGSTEGNWDDTNGTVRISSAPGGFSAIPEGSFAIALDATSDFT